MTPDTSNKFLVLLVLIFLILMLGPYLGFHPLGVPEITETNKNNDTVVENGNDYIETDDASEDIPDVIDHPEEEVPEAEMPKRLQDGFEER